MRAPSTPSQSPIGNGDFGVADKRLGAPRQFLRRETDQAAVVSQRRHDLAESETVGQEHILRLDAELLFIKLLCKQDVADKRLRRRHVRVVGLERSPRNVPSPVGYEFPDALEEMRIILLDPFVLDGAFEIEHVMRIFFRATPDSARPYYIGNRRSWLSRPTATACRDGNWRPYRPCIFSRNPAPTYPTGFPPKTARGRFR